MDWLDLLVVQGPLKESSPTPQFKSINSSVLSFLYGPTLPSIHDYWKIALTRQTFVGKVMSLLFNMLSRFVIGKGVRQGCILSPCLFKLYTEYIMRHARQDESQTGIKISGRNINNLRYADDNTLMAESEEEQKSLLMEVKEESEKAALKLNI